MAIAHDMLASAVGTLQGVAGQSFTVVTVNGRVSFTGVFNRQAFDPVLESGGFGERVDATILVKKSDLLGYWIPINNTRIECMAKIFTCVGIDEDAWSYTLKLKGPNQ